jgi:hypothetical protein
MHSYGATAPLFQILTFVGPCGGEVETTVSTLLLVINQNKTCINLLNASFEIINQAD